MSWSRVVDHSDSETHLHRALYFLTFTRASMVLLLFLCPAMLVFLSTGYQGLFPPIGDLSKLNAMRSKLDSSIATNSSYIFATATVLAVAIAAPLLWWFFDSVRSVRRRSLKLIAGVAFWSALAYLAIRLNVYIYAAQHLDPLFTALLAVGMVYAVALSLDIGIALWQLARVTEPASLHATFESRLTTGAWSAINKVLDLPRTPLRSPRALSAYALELFGAIARLAAFSVVVTMGGIDSKLDGILATCNASGLDACRAASAVSGREILGWFILALIGIQAGSLMQAAGKSLSGLSVPDAIKFAGGRFILYLRPFFVDRVILPHPQLPFFSRLLSLRPFPVRIEDELFDVADGFQPLVAIGDPNARRDAGGGKIHREAHREFLANADWRKVVTDRLRTADYVVVVIQETDGVLWELTQIVDGGFANKTVFLFDPSARDPAIWSRLAALAVKRFVQAGLLPPNFAFAGRPLGIFFQDGRLVEIHNANWSATSYRTAFSYFLVQQSIPAQNSTVLASQSNMQKIAKTEEFKAIDTVHVAVLARRIRVFWNALRLMLFPVIISSIGLVMYTVGALAGDPGRAAVMLPFLLIAPRLPILFYVYPVASWLSWIWIGRYGRITAACALACLSQVPIFLYLAKPSLLSLAGGVLSGSISDTRSQFHFVSILALMLIPQVLLAIAVMQFGSIVSLKRNIKKLTRGIDPLSAFRRIVRSRSQGYKKYNWAKVGILPLAFLGAIVSILFVLTIFAVFIDTFLSMPVRATLDFRYFQEFSKANPSLTLTRMLVELVSFFCAAAVVVWWVRFAWRRIRRRATEVLKEDPNYCPIVFLRSFGDENARVLSKFPLWWLIGGRVRLEEVIAGQLTQLGPCVAIGVPGERTPKLGAMRAYFADTDWQTAIRIWTSRSLLSVVVVGDTPSVKWELEHLIWSNRVSSLLAILPPDTTPQARVKRWQTVRTAFAGTRWQAGVMAADANDALCVIFDADGKVVCIKGWPRHQIDYEIAVQLAVARLLTPPAPASRST